MVYPTLMNQTYPELFELSIFVTLYIGFVHEVKEFVYYLISVFPFALSHVLTADGGPD